MVSGVENQKLSIRWSSATMPVSYGGNEANRCQPLVSRQRPFVEEQESTLQEDVGFF